MPQLSLAVKPFTVTQGSFFKLSSALFSVGAVDYSLSISVLGGSLFNNGVAIGVPSSFTLAELKLGKISFLADGTSLPSFYFQASANGFANSAETQPVLVYKAVNQAPVVSIPGLGSNGDALLKGGTITITRDMINASDAETPDAGNLQVKITTVKGGSFLLNGFAAKSFSLADVDNGSVSFKHDGKLLAPSFSLSVSDSDGKASSVKSTNSATVVFDGSQIAEVLPSNPHEIAVKAPLAITEGATLKLTAKNLPIAVSTDVVPLLSQSGLMLRVDSSEHCDVLVSGKIGPQTSFIVAELKAGLVSLKHDGSQLAPALELSLFNGDTKLDSLVTPFAFKTVNDLPTLQLSTQTMNAGTKVTLSVADLILADEETPEALLGASVFTVKSATGVAFYRHGESIPLKSFTYADIQEERIELLLLPNAAALATYSLTVADPYGATSLVAQGKVNKIPNQIHTGTLTISGNPVEGEVLHAVSTLADGDGLGVLQYSWFDAKGSLISNGEYLTLSSALIGKQLKVEARYIDQLGNPEKESSALTTVVLNRNELPFGSVTVSGNVAIGSTLKASANLSDADGLGTIAYTWTTETGAVAGKGPNLVISANLLGQRLKVIASYTDTMKTLESVASTLTEIVHAANNAPTGQITISGILQQGAVLTAASTLADVDGLSSLTYRWRDAAGNFLGEGPSLYLSESVLGKSLQVVASYTDGMGNAESVYSSLTASISANPVKISGLAAPGQTLSASHSIVDADGLGLITYTWKNAQGTILGQGTTLTLNSSDSIGKQLAVTASYTDGKGNLESFTSAFLNVADSYTPPTQGGTWSAGSAYDSIIGSALDDRITGISLGDLVNGNAGDDRFELSSVLFAAIDGGAGNDTLLVNNNFYLDEFLHSKLKNIEIIDCGTLPVQINLNAASILAITDERHSLQVISSNVAASVVLETGWAFTSLANGFKSYLKNGAILQIQENLTVTVPQGQNFSPIVLGTPKQGETLTGLAPFADPQGMQSLRYTWSNEAGQVLSTAPQLLLTQDMVHHQLRFSMQYTDGSGAERSLSSLATASVANFNDAPIFTITREMPNGQIHLEATNNLSDSNGAGIIYTWTTQKGNLLGHGKSIDLLPSYAGQVINCLETYTDTFGQAKQKSISNQIHSGAVYISGNAIVGQTITATNTLADADGISSLSYLWKDQLGNTLGTESSLIISPDNAGRLISVTASYMDFTGARESATSEQLTSSLSQFSGEFQVNTYTNSYQASPSATKLSDGGFLITWQSDGQDGSGFGIYAQRYDASGSAIGGEFKVNTYTSLQQLNPSVTNLADGGFLVSWIKDNESGGYSICAQRYDASSSASGIEFKVNTYTLTHPIAPSLTSLVDGGFIVSWHSFLADGSGYGIRAQLYDASGSAIGGEFNVNTYTLMHQLNSSVTGLSDGGFLVIWESSASSGIGVFGIYGQRYDASGAAIGSEFKVAHSGSEPTVTRLLDGGVITSWMSDDGGGDGIYAKRYAASGAPTGSEFKVNTYTNSYQFAPNVTSLADGGFLVTWSSNGQDGSDYGVYAQRYDASSASVGSEIKVNTYTNSHQAGSNVTSLDDGGFLVAWSSEGQDGSSSGVYAQRYDANGIATNADGIVGLNATWLGVTGSDNIIAALYGVDLVSNVSMGDTVRTYAGNDKISIVSNDFSLIDGGSGADTLTLSLNLDLTTIADNKIQNIEVIDLGANAITLKMALADVLAISGGTGALKIKGNAGTWDQESGWTFMGSADGFETYTKGAATVLVQNELNVV